MINLVALYRGETLHDVQTVYVSSEDRVVYPVIDTILRNSARRQSDGPLAMVRSGEQKALRKILEAK